MKTLTRYLLAQNGSYHRFQYQASLQVHRRNRCRVHQRVLKCLGEYSNAVFEGQGEFILWIQESYI